VTGGALLLQCGHHPNLGRVRLAAELPLAKLHVFRDPVIGRRPGQQSTAHRCLEDDADIRAVVGVVNESTEGSDGHAGRFYTFSQVRAA